MLKSIIERGTSLFERVLETAPVVSRKINGDELRKIREAKNYELDRLYGGGSKGIDFSQRREIFHAVLSGYIALKNKAYR